MKWRWKTPKNVSIIDKVYSIWIKLKAKTMKLYESVICRSEKLGKWFIDIIPEKVKWVVLWNT